MSLSHRLPLLIILVASPALAAPSFDCAKAGGWVEHTVCAQAALGDLDRELAELYAARRRGLGPADEATLRDAQRAWARGRAACEKQADGVDCLVRHYRQRLAALGGAALPAWAGELAQALAAIDGCLAATPSAGIAVTDLRHDGDRLLVTLRGATGRGFACRVAADGSGMVALNDAEAPPAGPAFERGGTNACPDAVPLASPDGGTIGWFVPPGC